MEHKGPEYPTAHTNVQSAHCTHVHGRSLVPRNVHCSAEMNVQSNVQHAPRAPHYHGAGRAKRRPGPV